MSEELLINVSPMESRVAIMNNGVLSEVYIERHNKMGLVGNIYLGTVVRVLPGMQAAFVEIGQSRTAFLHVNDMQRLPRPAPTLTELPDVRLKDDHKPTVLSAVADDAIEVSGASHSKSIDNNNTQTRDAVSTAPDNCNLVNKPDVSNNDNLNSKSQIITVKDNVNNTDNDVITNNAAEGGTNSGQTIELNEDSTDSPVEVGNAITADLEQKEDQQQPIKPKPEPAKSTPPKHALIQYRLQEGQQVLVQVTKDELGTKGARLTTNISLPSRYLVYLPSSQHIGISQRIDNMEERQRLKTELSALMQTVDLQGGLIARTAAERVPVAKLEEDIYYLLQLWRTIQARRHEALTQGSNKVAHIIYQDLSLPLRSIRDLVHQGTQRIVIDNEEMYNKLRHFSREFVPFVHDRIALYTSEQPLFDVHRVEEDLKDALKRRVDLKSGGYLIIDQTEAMTTIDVNTGSFIGRRSLEDTVYKTNLEATHAIARQLRIRNLGGIIILDFIDMLEQEHKDDVLNSLQQQLSQDYAKTKITQVSELGLVEMTRKRTRESLEQLLCEPCQTCQGRGFIKTAETVCFEIFREIVRCARTYNAPKKFTVVAHASVIDLLLTSEADTVADLEYLVGRVITFEVESMYTQEQYDIVLD